MDKTVSIQNRNMFADEVRVQFKDLGEFESFLTEYLEHSTWEVHNSSYGTIQLAQQGMFAQDDADKIPAEESEALALLDADQHYLLSFNRGSTLEFMSEVAEENLLKLLSLRSWYRFSNEYRYAAPAIEFLNYAMDKPESKKLLVRRSCGKIRGILSDNFYTILDQRELHKSLKDYIEDSYDDAEFVRAELSHDLTTVLWEIEDVFMVGPFAELFKSDDVQVRLSFETSDTGGSAAKVAVFLVVDGVPMMLGDAIAVPHKGEVTPETFAKKFDQIAASTNYYGGRLEELAKREIRFPQTAVENLANRSHLPKENMMTAQILLQIHTQPTALNLFQAINMAIDEMADSGVDARKIVFAREAVARMLSKSYDWSKIDIDYVR